MSRGFSLYGSSLYSSEPQKQHRGEDFFFVPHVLMQLANLPTSLQPEDVKLYHRLVLAQDTQQRFTIKRADLIAPMIEVKYEGVTEQYHPPKPDEFLVNWTTVPNVFQASFSSPLRVRTPRLLQWDSTKIFYNLLYFSDIPKYPLIVRDYVRDNEGERVIDEIAGGILFTGGIFSGLLSESKTVDHYTNWWVNDEEKMEKGESGSIVGDLITCQIVGKSVDPLDLQVDPANQVDPKQQDDYFALDPFPPIQNIAPQEFPLCQRNISVDLNGLNTIELGGQITQDGVAARRVHTGPMNLLNVTSTLVTTLGTSHSVLPVNLAELKSRPMWFKDFLFLNTDPKTRQDLIFQSFQRGVHHILEEFKAAFQVGKMPYEVNGKDTFMSVVNETLSKGSNSDLPKRNPTHISEFTSSSLETGVSAKWMRILRNSFNNSGYSVSMEECAKEFGLVGTLLEGSKILTLSHNFLLRCVGIDQNGSPSAEIGECYEECLPFDIIIEHEPLKYMGLDGQWKAGPRKTFSHLKQLELYTSDSFCQDVGKRFNKMFMTRQHVPILASDTNNAYNCEHFVESLIQTTPPHLHVRVKPTLPISSNISLHVPPSLVKLEVTVPKGAFNDVIRGNRLIEEVYIQGADQGHILSPKIGAFFSNSLHEILVKYDNLRVHILKSTSKTQSLMTTIIGSTLPSGLTPAELAEIWGGIEKKSLLCMMVNEICELWFQSFDIWMVKGADIRDLLFHYNNDPYRKPSPYVPDWKAVGCIGQASWYAAVQWVLSVLNLRSFSDDSLEKKQWELIHDVFFNWRKNSSFNKMDLQTIGEKIYDSLKYYFYSSLTCLAPDPKNTVSPSSMNQLLRELHYGFDWVIIGEHNDDQRWRGRFFNEWCLMMDGIRPMVQNAFTTASLFSEDLYNQYFQGFGSKALVGKDQHKTMRQHKTRVKTWETDFLPVSGYLIVKQTKSVSASSSSSSQGSIVNVGLSKSQTVLNGAELTQTHPWYPYKIELPKVTFPVPPIPKTFYPCLFPDSHEYTKPFPGKEYTLLMNSPNEYCLVTGDVKQSQRFSPDGIWSSNPDVKVSDYSILNGIQKEVTLAPFPMASSNCLVQGTEVLKEYFMELSKLERSHINRCLKSKVTPKKGGGRKKEETKEVKLSGLDYIRYKQIRYGIQQIRAALNQLSPEISPWSFFSSASQGEDYLSPKQDIADKVKTFLEDPSPPILSSYTLEWHCGTEYGGFKTFVSKGDIIPTVYRKSEGKDEEDLENTGVYTLWLISDNPNRQFAKSATYGRKARNWDALVSLLPQNLKNYSAEAIKITDGNKEDWLTYVGNMKAPLEQLSKDIVDSVSKFYDSKLDDVHFNPLHVVEDLITPDRIYFKSVYEQFQQPEEVRVSEVQTIDLNGIPSYTLTRICALQVTNTIMGEEKVDSKNVLIHRKDIKYTSFVKELGLMDTSSQGFTLDVSSRKYEPVTERFSVPSPYLTSFIQSGTTPSATSHPLKSKLGSVSKYMSGDYVIEFSQSMRAMYGTVLAEDSRVPIIGVPNHLTYSIWKEKFQQTLNELALQHFSPPGKYIQNVVHPSNVTPLSRHLQGIGITLTKLFNFLTQGVRHSKPQAEHLKSLLFKIPQVRTAAFRWVETAVSKLIRAYMKRVPLSSYVPKWTNLPEYTISVARFYQHLLMNLCLNSANTLDSRVTQKLVKKYCENLGIRSSRGHTRTSVYKNVLSTVNLTLWWTLYSLYEFYGGGKGQTPAKLKDAFGLRTDEKNLTYVLKHNISVRCLDGITGRAFIWDPRSNITLLKTLDTFQTTQVHKQRKLAIQNNEGNLLGDIPIREWVGGFCEFVAQHLLYNFFSTTEIATNNGIKSDINSNKTTLLKTVRFSSVLKYFGIIFENLEKTYLSYHNQGGEWDLDAWENSLIFGDNNKITWKMRFGKLDLSGRHALQGQELSTVDIIRLSLQQKMLDKWENMKDACLGSGNIHNAMHFLEEHEDMWAQLFLDFVQTLRDPHLYSGKYDERLCESLNLISRDFFLYLIFKECNKQVQELQSSLTPLLENELSKKLTLEQWGSRLLNNLDVPKREGFDKFCAVLHKKWENISQQPVNWGRTVPELSQRNIEFIWNLLREAPETNGDLIWSNDSTRKLVFVPTQARSVGRVLPAWISNWRQSFEDTWKHVKQFIKNPEAYTKTHTNPLGSFIVSVEGQLNSVLYSKYELLKMFSSYITPSGNVASTLDVDIRNTALFIHSQGVIYRHYETSILKAMGILPVHSQSLEVDNPMFLFEEWLKTCFLPSLMNGYWIKVNDPGDTETEEKIQQQWAIVLQKLIQN